MSIFSGQVISRTGRYRAFPIAGTAVMTVGLLLLSRLDIGTSTGASALYLLVLGLGLGRSCKYSCWSSRTPSTTRSWEPLLRA